MSRPIEVQRKLQVRRVPALLFLFFAGVTGYVLFEDVLHGAAITTSHVTSVAVLVATIAAGHYVLPQIKTGALVSALGLLVVFLAGTLYVVTSSGARNAETAANKKAAAAEIGAQRADLRRKRAEAGIILDACPADAPRSHHGIRCGLRDAMTAECRSGKGKRCDGQAYSVTTYEAAIAGYDAKLAALGPEQSADLYAHMGRVFAALPWVTAAADDIAARLALILPYVLVGVVEIATLTFGGMAIGHRDVPVPLDTVTDAELAELRAAFLAPPDGVRPAGSDPLHQPPPPRGGRPMLVVDRKAEHPLIAELKRGGPAESQDELAGRLGLSKGEVSKTVAELSDRLTVTRSGRCNRIALAG